MYKFLEEDFLIVIFESESKRFKHSSNIENISFEYDLLLKKDIRPSFVKIFDIPEEELQNFSKNIFPDPGHEFSD